MPRSPAAQSPAGRLCNAWTSLCLQAVGELLLRIGIGKQVLDAGEPGRRGGGEAVEKVELVVEHGEIGRELRHGFAPLSLGLPGPDNRPSS